MKMAKSDTKKYSLDELREMRERGETETRADAPQLKLDADFWQGARVVMPPGKSSVHLRVVPTCWSGSRRKGAAI